MIDQLKYRNQSTIFNYSDVQLKSKDNYDNNDGTMVESPIKYPDDPAATAAIKYWEKQKGQFWYNNVTCGEPNYGPKTLPDEKPESKK